MKKLVILFSACLFCLSGIAGNLGESWVITKDGKMDCKKVNLGYNKARIVLENGQKMTVNFNSISSFSMDGSIFSKLPLYEDGKPTNQMAFMELVTTQGDLSLYKLAYNDYWVPNISDVTYRYFLYKGNRLHLALDEKTLPNVCLNFGVSYDDL